jgi:hypothetical protein
MYMMYCFFLCSLHLILSRLNPACVSMYKTLTLHCNALCSLEKNGLHRHVPEPVTNQASNNSVAAAAAAVVTTTATTGAKASSSKKKQQVTKNATSVGVKRAPPSPSKETAGSRCSRKNGRGWRCSQPTLGGYALCQYHLGKGRIKSGSAETGGRGPGQLGRTEHANKKTSPAAAAAAAVAPATAAAPKAVVPPKTSAAIVAPAATATAPKADVPRASAAERAAMLGA